MGEPQEAEPTSASSAPPKRGGANGDKANGAEGCAKQEFGELIAAVVSDDIGARYAAGEGLRAKGRDGAAAIVETVLNGKKYDFADRLELIDALEDFGKVAVKPIMGAIERLSRLASCEDVHLLELFAGALLRIEGRKGAAQLIEQVRLLDAAAANQQRKKLAEICHAAEQRLHMLLADEGVREGLDDLLKTLGEGRSRVQEDLLVALGHIGDKRTLVPLVRLYAVEQAVSEHGARLVKYSFRKIVLREKIGRDDAVFGLLTDTERPTLDRLYPRARQTGDNSQPHRDTQTGGACQPGNGKT
ncbi:MAG: hypothetical protein RDV41_12655 [Planctomycetota bacterium]|nr:hypothetical protein [Planctomycetota bacterium]